MYGQTTKICKFYRSGRPDSCRNGDTCWFIHDDEVRPRSRRSSRTNSQDDSTGIKISLGGQGGRRVVIDPKYKYIADKAKASSTSSSVVVVQKPAQSIDAASKSSNLQHKDLKKKEEPLFDPNIYSAMDKLTVEDLNQFKADDFTLGQIPLMPPPLELS